MSDIYGTLRGRALAIVTGARGHDGSLGPDAQEKSIPALRFRDAVAGAPLRDPTYPSESFDRAVRLDWLAEVDSEGVNNPLDGPQIMDARVTVTHGVTYGAALAAFVATAGSEVGADVVLLAQERALRDARRIKRALACPGLIRDSADDAAGIVPIACVREGSTTLETLGGGRMLAVTVYQYTFQTDNTSSDDP